MEKLVLIDGHSILNRAFYGVPELTNSEGLHTNTVYGFLNIMFKILEEEKADYKEEIYTDITKVPKKALEELIKNKLNIELTSINGYEEFEKNFYSEKYDCYYLQHGDTNYQQIEFLSGEKNDDDTYTFIYNGYSHTTFTQQEFKLKCYIDNDVYVIISNLPNN